MLAHGLDLPAQPGKTSRQTLFHGSFSGQKRASAARRFALRRYDISPKTLPLRWRFAVLRRCRNNGMVYAYIVERRCCGRRDTCVASPTNTAFATRCAFPCHLLLGRRKAALRCAAGALTYGTSRVYVEGCRLGLCVLHCRVISMPGQKDWFCGLYGLTRGTACVWTMVDLRMVGCWAVAFPWLC